MNPCQKKKKKNGTYEKQAQDIDRAWSSLGRCIAICLLLVTNQLTTA